MLTLFKKREEWVPVTMLTAKDGKLVTYKTHRCPDCKKEHLVQTNYCPHCGRRRK